MYALCPSTVFRLQYINLFQYDGDVESREGYICSIRVNKILKHQTYVCILSISDATNPMIIHLDICHICVCWCMCVIPHY